MHRLEEKMKAFQQFWGPTPPQGCPLISASGIKKIDKDDPKATKDMRATYLRLKFSGGIASWGGTGNVWNIVMLEDVALHALVTDDAIDFMLCHEMGHYFVNAADNSGNPDKQELMSDLYAVQTCLPTLWQQKAGSGDYRKRAKKAVESGMAYYKDFLETAALGAGEEDRKTLACRKAVDLAALGSGKAPGCVDKRFEADFAKKLRKELKGS